MSTPANKETPVADYSLTNVEEGFARVMVGRRTVGRVSREKYGSTRTGTHWIARSSWNGIIGYAATRDAAAKLVADDYTTRAARA